MASSSSGKYDGVIKSGLKLKGGDKNKEVGVKVAKKKKKTQEDVLTEELQANAEQESQEQAELQKGAAQGPTSAQKTFQLAREKRGNQRINEAIKYTHRQRMDKLNAHLGSLSEHFDIPKVGPGWDLQALQAAGSLAAWQLVASMQWGVLHMALYRSSVWLWDSCEVKKGGKIQTIETGRVSLTSCVSITLKSFFPFSVTLMAALNAWMCQGSSRRLKRIAWQVLLWRRTPQSWIRTFAKKSQQWCYVSFFQIQEPYSFRPGHQAFQWLFHISILSQEPQASPSPADVPPVEQALSPFAAVANNHFFLVPNTIHLDKVVVMSGDMGNIETCPPKIGEI